MNLDSYQITWKMVKLKRKQFKKIKKEIDSSLSKLTHRWILKNISSEGTEHDNFLSSGLSKNQTKSIT
jgi:hypothetical protein